MLSRVLEDQVFVLIIFVESGNLASALSEHLLWSDVFSSCQKQMRGFTYFPLLELSFFPVLCTDRHLIDWSPWWMESVSWTGCLRSLLMWRGWNIKRGCVSVICVPFQACVRGHVLTLGRVWLTCLGIRDLCHSLECLAFTVTARRGLHLVSSFIRSFVGRLKTVFNPPLWAWECTHVIVRRTHTLTCDF